MGQSQNEPKQKAHMVFKKLEKVYPGVKTTLDYDSTWQLLVATILSAQCTDARVNIVTKTLFKKYPTVNDYAGMSQKALEKEIHSTGFYHNKAKNILASAKLVKEKFGGEVPQTMEELVSLPGVGRKTASIVLSSGYGKNQGMAVDTHVKRLSQRIGLSKHKQPEKIEQDLLKIVPQKDWDRFSLLLIHHGRAICQARKPKCEKCVLNKICESAFRV